ncbi:MAG: hypothetical protein IJU72_04210 [Bacteroidales bacterium]|nr:hypothetical protein [Bacteroidales bacterium]
MKRRELKKDIDFLVGEVINDCYTCMLINDEKKHGQVAQIMEDIVATRNDLIQRANIKPEGKGKAVKAHFTAIRKELLTAVDTSFGKLSEVAKG